ncbi:16S rRNA (cytosine(967)-C(5))-methyltransferase RsmB [Nitrospira sp. Kam-Ns4a]
MKRQAGAAAPCHAGCERPGVRVGARAAALAALVEVERRGTPADDALERAFGGSGVEGRDRPLVHELLYGVLRHRATLDWLLDHVADRPVARLPLVVATALRLGAYQLRYLDRIPAAAAVHESVELVKRLPGDHWPGFVNAVLRQLACAPTPPWPSADQDPAGYLAVRYSCPGWLAERWLARLGCARAEAVCRAMLAVPPLTVRANRLRVTREELAADLARAGCVVRPTAVSPVGLVLEPRGPVTELPQLRQGLCYVEDEAAQLIPLLVDPQPGARVLDACAAPGGKTTHLAALMGNKGEIVALDRHPKRLARLRENCERLGVRIVTPVVADATDARALARLGDRLFDRILVDAPCSGLGVLRRHPEGKWQKTAARLLEHRATQLALLDRVSRLLRPGGVLVYSTCSTEPEENEQVIEAFCARHAEYRRESVAPWLPPGGAGLVTIQGDLSTMVSPAAAAMDAFFAARLRKVAPV